MAQRVATLDIAEFARFFSVGVIATCSNMAVVWLIGHSFGYVPALICGTTAGLVVSFVLSKIFAFKSKSWNRAPDEVGRFLLVYVVGAVISWVIALIVGHQLLLGYIDRPYAEQVGALVGASIMMFTSYFGHRFFTYRTFQVTDAVGHLDP